ncbi:MAG: D-aminoacylase, partial [Bacteroidota bacterium]
MRVILILIIFLHALTSCNGQPTTYDIILRGGTVIDGSGGEPFSGDVAINGDSIAAIGDLSTSAGRLERDITGLVIAPGFINMLSWAEGSLLEDGRSMSDLKQGVTLEVFGEGWSPGPRKITPRDKRWTTLGSYFDYAMKKGVTPNIASFVGATSVRMYVLKAENRAPSAEELRQMKGLVRQAMKEGAMGLGSSLIYAPADYASTTELIELAR